MTQLNQNNTTEEVEAFTNIERILFARTVSVVTTIMNGLEQKFTEKADRVEKRLASSNSKNPRPNRFELGQLSAFEEIYSGLQQFLALEKAKVAERIEKLEETNE